MATRSRSSRRGREGEDESRYLLVIPGRASANPESRSYHFAHHFEIPDRSTLRTVRNDGEQKMLNFYGREFSSRLLIGSALYPSPAIMQGAIRTSGALKLLRDRLSDVTLVVDAGLGAPSHAAQALELGYDAVLLNTAIAKAADPVAMAGAFRSGVEAGRLAYEAGLMEARDFASPSTPVVGTPFWHAVS